MSNMEHITKKDKAKVKNSVISAIRRSFSRSEHYNNFLEIHRVEWLKGRRKRVSYKCIECEGLFGRGFINVDHIKPIGRGVYNSIGDAEYFYKLVYCEYSNLQILCKDCHKVKTKKENKIYDFSNAIF